jgi:glycosyltransferase involved in cell wall biosynthesis
MTESLSPEPKTQRVPAAQPLPLRDKTVLLVHPAWHSCGSHKVFVSQAEAYRALGARVVSLAIADAPGATQGSRSHKIYSDATKDLETDARFFTGMPWEAVFQPSFLRAVGHWLHGNFAQMLVETTKRVTIPEPLCAVFPKIDIIHCNHFFCMPAAKRIAAAKLCPIVLDTHDLQARQYVLRNRAGWSVPPVATYEEMLGIELDCLRRADVLIHLNDEEATAFKDLLPDKRHVLLYPAVTPIEPGAGGADIIIVASANYANFLSVVWFLTEVLPQIEGVPVKILGNVNREVKTRAPNLYRQHAALFRGRVDRLDTAYGGAKAVLLPTTQGHGISIKTIEAMSSGAPLIATPHAFRGLIFDPAALGNVTLASDAAAFAHAIRNAAGTSPEAVGSRASADTRKCYERYFAPEPYRQGLAALVAPMLAK